MPSVSRITATGGYAFDSASPRIAGAGFYVFFPVPAGVALIRFSTGDLLVNIEKREDGAYLIFKDGVNDIEQLLPFTDEQLDGLEWAIIKLTRSDGNLVITCDKAVVATIPIEYRVYGGMAYVGESAVADLFDIRVLGRAISLPATEYYIDDLIENDGNEMLPKR
jgi:hypothetical protein